MFSLNFLRCLHTSRPCWSTTEKSLLAQLRKKTGYTFINCKKALELNGNDINKAELWLKQQAQSLGWSKATKLEGRSTSQGLVGVFVDKCHAAIVEVNCETDFVARNKNFQAMVDAAAIACVQFAQKNIIASGPLTKIGLDAESLRSLPHTDGKSLADHLALMIGTVGENASLRRALCYKAEAGIDLAGCAHPAELTYNDTMLGKYGAVIALKYRTEQINHSLGKQLCQHIIGMNPKTIGIEGKDEPSKNSEEETCLIFQEFLMDPATPVSQILFENAVEIIDYKRFECGESLITKKDDEPIKNIVSQ